MKGLEGNKPRLGGGSRRSNSRAPHQISLKAGDNGEEGENIPICQTCFSSWDWILLCSAEVSQRQHGPTKA
ncbi:hypothetical protein MRB53_025047 [Persea americana]|uniref:Uncharacterized protein n=1 Tax=Persea americana TaxID=3435 RepID=A0ACC2LFA6_PERAE|nr:hypothetical protein MRB53_025047 [Persea americana]